MCETRRALTLTLVFRATIVRLERFSDGQHCRTSRNNHPSLWDRPGGPYDRGPVQAFQTGIASLPYRPKTNWELFPSTVEEVVAHSAFQERTICVRNTIHRTILWVIALCWMFAGSCSGESQQGRSLGEKSCFWRVTSKTSTVYILGSVHLMKAGSRRLSPIIEKSFKRARKLVLEVSPDAMNRPKVVQALRKKGMFHDGKTLKQTLSKETYDLAKKRTAELGMNIEQMAKFKPWSLSTVISSAQMAQLGYDPNQGVDKYFANKAKKARKEIVALETMEYQFACFDDMTPETQELMLLQTLKDVKAMESEFNQIVGSWAAGNIKAMESVLLESFGEYPEVYNRLIVERNHNWLPHIESYLAQGDSVMVVVGALHLVGKDGLIELLKQKGYTVEQL